MGRNAKVHQTVDQNPTVTAYFRLEMPMQSKLRPRVANGKAYHSLHYKHWLSEAVCLLSEQWKRKPPLTTVGKVTVQFWGKKTCDLDNAIGSVFDALTQAKVWKDDRLVQHLEAAFEPSKVNLIEVWVEF